MKRAAMCIGLWVLVAVICVCSGCANLKPRVVMTSDGPAVVLTTDQNTWGDFVANNWGKGLTTLGAGAGLVLIEKNNHYLGGKSHGSNSDNTSTTTDNGIHGTVTVSGQNNNVYVIQGTDQSSGK